MYINRVMLSLLGAASMGILTTALQANYYSDDACKNFMGSAIDPPCDGIPKDSKSWLIVCDPTHDECLGLEFYTSNGTCTKESRVDLLQCPCEQLTNKERNNGTCLSATWLSEETPHSWGSGKIERAAGVNGAEGIPVVALK